MDQFFEFVPVLEIAWVHQNCNNSFHKINLSDIRLRYLFKIYFLTELFYNKISNI